MLHAKKKKNVVTPQPNKKGQGFRIFRPQPKKVLYENASRRLRLAMIAASVLAAAGLYFTGKHTNLDVTVTVGAMMALSGLLIYDIISGMIWDKSTKAQLGIIERNHDRLVREVARNRNDIALLKDETGTAALRKELSRTLYNRGVMELEISPPALKEPAAEQNNGKRDLSDSFVTELLHYSVRNDKIAVHVQPVVGLPDGKPQMIELFARLPSRSGTYLTATRYLEMAQQENITASLDNLLLLRCLSMLRDKDNHGPALPYVINVSPVTLKDGGFMGDLVTFLAQEKKIARRLVFELPQAELETLDKKTQQVLQGLVQIGCRFSIDRVRSKIINIRQMKRLGISYIKLDAAWIIKESKTSKGFARINLLKKQLAAAQIDLIADRIETVQQLRSLNEIGFSYGQGYLFGKPALYETYRDKQNKAA